MQQQSDKKIKIVYIIGRLVIGGAEKQITETAARINRDIFDVRLYCLSEGGPLEAFVREHHIDTTIFESVRYTSFPSFVSYLLTRLKKFQALYRYLKREQPDIVHCYMFAPSIYGGIISRLTGHPILITNRRCLGLFKENKPLFQFLENMVNRFTDLVLVNSKALRDDVLQREKIDPQKVRIIYNGVNIQKFTPIPKDSESYALVSETKQKLGIPNNDGIIVGMLATLFPYKGHRDFITAASIVHRTYPKIWFVCVGADRGIREELQQLGHHLGLSSHLIFPGEFQDAAEILPVFDIQVSASCEEGFSNAILEGMASGIPMITTDVGGTPEAVQHEVTGLLVPPKDPEKLALAMMSLIENPECASRLGMNGRKRVESRFSMEEMIHSLEHVYMELYETQKHA
ncbi:hypothetical protein CSA56_04780 [candidate division KSB3 bacterium]|uniref:Glycosyl transferase n=1 Tax=candidate division KSB3 bacterium TaxID=2044937 RepID=A0A2G6KHZ5_9BACT|nr:MAG: hypothetical protein CSA56_04780 [candidate division KSB3 bacterium]